MKRPTLCALSIYPLKMIAAEWMTYLELMHHSIKQYEFSSTSAPVGLEQIQLLNADIRTLQQWTRRGMASADKIRYTVSFLKNRMTKGDDMQYRASLMEDYKYIASSIGTYTRRLEALVFVTTSLIQTIDCRRSLTETVNISRLTYAALVFIPLTFVSSLLSMNNTVASDGRVLGLYFAVAMPLCVVVFLIAHPPARFTGILARQIRTSTVIPKCVI